MAAETAHPHRTGLPAAGTALARREAIAAWFFFREASRLHEIASPAVASSGPPMPP